MYSIPQNKKWTQDNSGEVFGMLHCTKNINFDKEGYAQLARRPVAVIYGGTNIGMPVSMHYLKAASGTGYYMMTDDRPFRIALGGSSTSVYDGTVAIGSIKNDGLVFNGKWYVSQSAGYAYYTGASWSALKGSLTTYDSSTAGHPMGIWESENCLAIGDYNTVKLYDISDTLVQTLTLPANFEVKWIRYNNQNLYIGTKNKTGGNAVMFVWTDSSVSSAAQAWPVPSNWMWSGVVHSSSIVTCISNGQVLRFNGGGWDMLGAFPVYYSNYSWFQGSGYVNGRMEQRGMISDGHIIYLVIDGYVGDDQVYLDNQPSGLWVLDPNVGLYHKAGVTNDKFNIITISSVDTGTSIFTASGTFTALTGVKVFYKATGSASGGLKAYKYYYLIRSSGTTFKLATTYANAIAGTFIAISAGGSTETLNCCDELDAGASLQSVYQPGAIGLVSELDAGTTASANGFGYMGGSQVLFGSYLIKPDSSGTSTYTVQSLATSYNRGYIITQKLFSPNVIENWSRLVAKCNRLFQTSDKILVKYRTSDKPYYPLMATVNGADRGVWSDSDTFTTTTDMSSVVAGEEIEFLAGRGAGLTAHVTSISVSTGTYTVNLDEQIPGVSNGDYCGFAVQNWTKIGLVSMSEGNSVFDSTAKAASQWIQVKVECRGHSEPLVEELRITNSVNK